MWSVVLIAAFFFQSSLHLGAGLMMSIKSTVIESIYVEGKNNNDEPIDWGCSLSEEVKISVCKEMLGTHHFSQRLGLVYNDFYEKNGYKFKCEPQDFQLLSAEFVPTTKSGGRQMMIMCPSCARTSKNCLNTGKKHERPTPSEPRFGGKSGVRSSEQNRSIDRAPPINMGESRSTTSAGDRSVSERKVSPAEEGVATKLAPVGEEVDGGQSVDAEDSFGPQKQTSHPNASREPKLVAEQSDASGWDVSGSRVDGAGEERLLGWDERGVASTEEDVEQLVNIRRLVAAEETYNSARYTGTRAEWFESERKSDLGARTLSRRNSDVERNLDPRDFDQLVAAEEKFNSARYTGAETEEMEARAAALRESHETDYYTDAGEFNSSQYTDAVDGRSDSRGQSDSVEEFDYSEQIVYQRRRKLGHQLSAPRQEFYFSTAPGARDAIFMYAWFEAEGYFTIYLHAKELQTTLQPPKPAERSPFAWPYSLDAPPSSSGYEPPEYDVDDENKLPSLVALPPEIEMQQFV